MSFDLRPWLIEAPDESQVHEGGANWENNCVVASAAYVMWRLGYEDYAPQNWVRDEYGPGHMGYTDLEKMTAEVARHFPNPPLTVQSNPPDNLAYVSEMGRLGYPCEVVYNSDASGNIHGRRGSFHACIPVAFDGSRVWVWKTESGLYDRLTPAEYADATSGSNAGATVCFQKPLPGFAGGDDDLLLLG